MIGKRFAVRITAAVIGAFGSAFAQSGYEINANPNVGVDANVGIANTDVNASANISSGVNVGSGDQSVSSSTSASQQSTDVNSSSTMGGATASSDDRFKGAQGQGHAYGHEKQADRAKGLDRADGVAGGHGQHGRGNARSNQAGG